MSLSFINIDTTLFRHFHSRKDHVFELISYILAQPSRGPRPLQVFILFFFLARPTDPPSRETGRWEKKHFIGVASVKKKSINNLRVYFRGWSRVCQVLLTVMDNWLITFAIGCYKWLWWIKYWKSVRTCNMVV